MNYFIIDDHPLVRTSVESVLSLHFPDSTCTGFSSMEEALPQLKLGCPDLILLDLSLSGMGGIEALKIIKTLCPLMPTIILSGSEDPIDIRLSLEAGADGYLLKKESSHDIALAIKDVLKGNKHIPNILRVEQGSKGTAVKSITTLQSEILTLIAQGKRNNEISHILTLSEASVKKHNRDIFRILAVNNRSQAVQEGIRLGLIKPH